MPYHLATPQLVTPKRKITCYSIWTSDNPRMKRMLWPTELSRLFYSNIRLITFFKRIKKISWHVAFRLRKAGAGFEPTIFRLWAWWGHHTSSPLKWVNPAAGSPTATLLRLRSSYLTDLKLVDYILQEPIPSKKINCVFGFYNQWKSSDLLNFQSVTGGEYKAQVQIHRGVLIHDY